MCQRDPAVIHQIIVNGLRKSDLAKMDALIAMEYVAETKEIEIGQLIMKYGHIRVHRPEIASSLMNSVERCGQIIPVITVKESDLSFVLIDGYLRVAALKRCGKDTVAAEIWQCNEQNALIRVLMCYVSV